MNPKPVKILLFFILITCISYAQDNNKEQTYQRKHPHKAEQIQAAVKEGKPKNVILMVGDGMSLSIMYTAWTANRGQLNIENCQFVGLSKTYSASDLITDSGAGATAFATGNKTNNGSVGVDALNQPVKSIASIVKEHKLSTGLIATCNILDATPSAFVAHTNDRDKWDDIALEYLTSGTDFVAGGGWENFSKGKDGRDLTKELSQLGYQLPKTVSELEGIKTGKVFALVADDFLPIPEKRGSALENISMKAIDLLSQNKDGFFLMIEGSMIDDRAHDNKLDLMVDETLDFDRTIGKVLKWAANDGNTLVIVTADHETGGWTMTDGDLKSGTVTGSYSTSGHSGVMVPVYSFGPGAQAFSGIYENTALFTKIVHAFGF